MRDMQALCRRYAGVMRYMQGHVGVMQASWMRYRGVMGYMQASCRRHALPAGRGACNTTCKGHDVIMVRVACCANVVLVWFSVMWVWCGLVLFSVV